MCGRALQSQRPIISLPMTNTSAPLPLSAVLIVHNAASQLGPCLVSLAFADDIVVVDSGSEDGTQTLAARHGARVIDQPWLGFGPQKRFAVAQARHDWVLCLDADERVTPELVAAIRKEISAPQAKVFRMARCNRFMGRYLRHGEGYPDWNIRFFDRRHAEWSEDVVHEHVVTRATVGTLTGDLLHDSAESLDRYLAKQNRYTTLAAEAAFRRGKRAGLAHLLLSPLLRFFRMYIVRLGFLDGLPGFVHIVIGCFNSFSKYAKLRALQTRESSPS